MAFVISLFGGLFSGLGFGGIMLRCFISTIFFAGAAFIIWQIVRRYLPELLESSVPESKGSHIDTVVEGDDEQIENLLYNLDESDNEDKRETERIQKIQESEFEPINLSALRKGEPQNMARAIQSTLAKEE